MRFSKAFSILRAKTKKGRAEDFLVVHHPIVTGR
jgi:hypothetical protein